MVGGAGEHLCDPHRHEQRLVHHLAPCEAEHGEAQSLQLGVARAVALEGDPVAVAGPAVGLDDQPLARPEEVERVPT